MKCFNNNTIAYDNGGALGNGGFWLGGEGEVGLG